VNRPIGPWSRALLVVVGLLAAATLVPSAAGAHGGEVRLDLLEAVDVPGGIEVAVRVTYVNDGHGADDATVTAVVVSDDGADAPGTPVPLPATGEEGVHGGTVPVPAPGPWIVRVTSVEPTASTEVRVDVPAPPIATAPTTGGVTVAPTPIAETVPAAPPGDPIGTSGSATDPTDSDGPALWIWLLGGAAAIVAVGAGVVLVRQGSRQGPLE
jgi:hypothetical protein